jgi:hypothetical protein
MTYRRGTEHASSRSPPDNMAGGDTLCCAWDGCDAPGEHRAPKDRDLVEYHMFCLEHVRVYNASWNFQANLSCDEIEAEIRSAVTWDRPTWKVSAASPRVYNSRPNVRDPFGFGRGTDFGGAANAKAYAARPRGEKTSAENAALRIFDLTAPLSLEILRGRYKILVKRHHPDANGGSSDAEQRMKIINEAYRTLRMALTQPPDAGN